MRDVTEWMRSGLASGREGLLPGQAVREAVHHSPGAERADVPQSAGVHGSERSITDLDARIRAIADERLLASLFVGSITELNSGPALPAAEPRSAGLRGSDHTSYTLRQARLRIEELTRANRRKDEFLAMLGHELRNPLASIHNALGLLRRQMQATPECQRADAIIERQIHRMTQLVDDLLDVSRVTHGRLRLHCERVDLRAVVNHAIETLDSDIHQRNHRLTTTLPDDPVWLQADPRRLEQVFINLLANACKYTDVGGELVLSMHAQDNQAVVRVRDSGIGIAPEFLPHIFELFRQADQAAARSQSGLGIGLALVRNLVECHGGTVIAASAGVGWGSEFTVRLPQEG